MPVHRTVLLNVNGVTHEGELAYDGADYTLYLYRAWSYLVPRPDERPRGVIRHFRAGSLSQLVQDITNAGITVSPSEWRVFSEIGLTSIAL